jgi:ribosome-binding factor A
MSRTRKHAPSQRQLRVGEEVRHAMAEILASAHLHDPDLVGQSVTVTEVRMSPDLRNATVFVTPLGGFELARVVTGLRRAAPFLRGELARALDLRFVPRLSFEPDLSFDEAARIERLLAERRVRRDLASEEPQDESDDGA